MAVAAERGIGSLESIAERRLLSDVHHLVQHMDDDGTVPPDVLEAIKVNKRTGLDEMAIPAAVTTTIQRLETRLDEQQRRRRVFTWLGMTAVDVAMSGFQFYTSPAGRLRGYVEVAEAAHSQDTLMAGRAQAFVSPQMSPGDAPIAVAKAEHLYGQDAVRVSDLLTDKAGIAVARRTRSLLVSDVSLSAWVTMFKDPDNIFGKAYSLENEQSALSVMGLFDQLDVPAEILPEGPVSLVRAVAPYISNPEKRQSVLHQITRFQTGQEEYRRQSERGADAWLAFGVELARSLKQGTATASIEAFIGSLQHNWGDADRATINRHDIAGKYLMTNKLAAVLEKAERALIASQIALATGNEAVIAQADSGTVQVLRVKIREIERMQQSGIHPEYIAARQAELFRAVAGQNFKVGGGCAGGSSGDFKANGTEYAEDGDPQKRTQNTEAGEVWVWKKGVCRVKACPSPQPTEVGPCSVCRNCQHRFDRGQDPTKQPAAGHKNEGKTEHQLPGDIWKHMWQELSKARQLPERAEATAMKRRQGAGKWAIMYAAAVY